MVDRAVHVVVGTRAAYCSLPLQVILHTDHCAKKLLPWMDGMLSASERYHETHGEPLFSSRGTGCKSRAAPTNEPPGGGSGQQPRARLLPEGPGRAAST